MPVASLRKSSRLKTLDSGFRRSDVAVISYAIALASPRASTLPSRPVLDAGVGNLAPSPSMGEGWGEGEIRNPPSLPGAQPLMVSLSNHVAIRPLPNPVHPVHRCKTAVPSPSMGEGWGEGEIRHPPSLPGVQPLMVSLSNHVAIRPLPNPVHPVHRCKTAVPLSLDGRGLG